MYEVLLLLLSAKGESVSNVVAPSGLGTTRKKDSFYAICKEEKKEMNGHCRKIFGWEESAKTGQGREKG